MSQLPPAGNPADPARRTRPASVVLRQQGEQGADLATLMDPATKSLADALRITYRILQLSMVVLVVVFLFSGVQTVQSNEKGVRLFLGKIDTDDLQPGFQMTLPAPFGELVTVPAGIETIKLEGDFWPNVPEGDRKKSPAELKNSPRGKLDPAVDGSLITADGNLAHARFTVTYRRERVSEFLKTLDRNKPEDTDRMVRAAIRRGVVHASSTVSIDEFLKDQPDAGRRVESFRAIAGLAKEVAQDTLNSMKTGITLTELTIQDRTPPIDTIKEFEKVQTEQARANELTQVAEQGRIKVLTASAGQAYEPLLKLIDRYDAALSSHDAQAGEAVLKKIEDVMDGAEVEFDGQKLQAGVGGKVARALSSAREYRSSIVSRSQADAALFTVKRDSFKNNPSVLLTGEWTDAFRTFMKRDNVEMMVLPPGSRSLQLLLNTDPTIRRQQTIAATQAAAAKRAQDDAQQYEIQKFESQKKPEQLNSN